ncbi:dihydroneopterin aldolase [Ruixingdingia sedimenti]|uniref:dihydroneopterin aldolase n=1 Tax=Ruixingdingia sedimenti TaxID=3073604 RepID=A0ABU1FE18_9RHOB|nr:dihydroneopterin aldolase [Xinfangfangia sp. LG-4]MDR5655144.1 dihydroneopterin aldolase [Xinfangfangia sp. LG-4]
MPTDIHLAFAHPEERAEATAPADPRDRISLRDHVVEAEIGAFQQERGHRQRLRFDVVVEVRPPPAPLDDDVDRILSYDRIAEAIAGELAAERVNLLETLAERVAERVLAEPQAMRIFIRIEKLDRGPGALGVEIARSRAAAPVRTQDARADALHPLVVHLDNAAIAAPDLAARLDALQGRGLPVVLTVGLPDTPRPASAVRPAQRRIDLLAIEQNAWVLAGRDPRCIVVATRTEIDWAMRHGQMVVWAPSKVVLDAVDGPKGTDPLALALWLAEHLAADRLVVHGPATVPAGSRVPVERAGAVGLASPPDAP